MSTYSTIHGTVTLDRLAAEAFKQSMSWKWCAPEPAAGLSVNDSAERLILHFGGAHYRNLTRYIHVDLAHAQQAGDVHGMLTDDCQDGVHGRTVTRYDGRTNLTGAGECFHEPVAASRGKILALGEPAPLMILIPSVPLGVLKAESTAEEHTEVVELTGAPPCDQCECGGYTDDDEPVCVNGGVATGTSTGGQATIRVRLR
jgi:hypothetical protein